MRQAKRASPKPQQTSSRSRLQAVPTASQVGAVASFVSAQSDVISPKDPGDSDGLSAEKYKILFDQAADAIFAVTSSGLIVDANGSAEEMSGYSREELVQSELAGLMPQASRHSIPARARAFSREMLNAPGTYEDVAVARKDGYVRCVELSVRTTGPLTLLIFRDVTEKKQMERDLLSKHVELRDAFRELERKNAELQALQETLVQAGKMAALGELAAGVAHELNQPLQSIRGYSQELQHELKGASDFVTSSLKEVVSGADKMAAIISHLRAFTRKSVEEHEETDVHLAIEEALKMLGRQLASRGISVERNFAADLPKVFANPLQLEQVFINLATNARDAIEATGRGSGRIAISSRIARVGGADVVEIEFKDDGCGMSEKTKTKAFNPFFTTKEVGKGMGLGLSLSFGMISKIHGSIVVDSELGKGTVFRVHLPRDYRELA